MRRTSVGTVLTSRPPCLWSGHDQVLWHPVRGVVGCSLPRRPTTAAIDSLAVIAQRLAGSRAEPLALVLDASRVEEHACDGQLLQRFRSLVLEPLVRHPRSVRRMVFVGGAGLAQCALLGSLVAMQPPFPWSVVERLADGLKLCDGSPLARPRARFDASARKTWSMELLGLLNSELSPLGEVSRVRAVLAQRPGANVDEVAQSLGISRRTLQRALSLAATTFVNERTEARLELAAARLVHSDQKVSGVARDVGYASLSRFVSIFNQRFGATPAAFRERQRSPEFTS